MYASMYDRLKAIATADSDREQELGAQCPTRLDLFLIGGHIIRNVALVDGENSLDDASIDIAPRGGAIPHHDWPITAPLSPAFVAIAAIAAVVETWPTDDDCSRAKARAS